MHKQEKITTTIRAYTQLVMKQIDRQKILTRYINVKSYRTVAFFFHMGQAGIAARGYLLSFE